MLHSTYHNKDIYEDPETSLVIKGQRKGNAMRFDIQTIMGKTSLPVCLTDCLFRRTYVK